MSNSVNFSDSEIFRFRSKTRTAKNGCVLWLGPLDKDGYGTFFFRRRPRRAHRVAWAMMFGKIAPGLFVNHKCRNRACVNPQHLETITPRENTLTDSVSAPALNARKTHCKNGHAFDKTVTWGGKTQRVCSACQKAKQKRLRAKWAKEDSLKGSI